MSPLDHMIARAQNAPKHIVLAEGDDPRIIKGAIRAVKAKVAHITLIGDETKLRPRLGDAGHAINVIEPRSVEKYISLYREVRKHKKISKRDAKEALLTPLTFANMMVQSGDADGSVTGAVNTTPDVVRSALQIIGVDQRYDLISSLFIMIMPDRSQNLKGGVIFSDCGLVINPDAYQLAHIASAASYNAKMLLGLNPKVAMLSFSTYGSAKHPLVEKVQTAMQILRERHPDLPVDGEIQFDAAIMPDIAKLKAPNSTVAGHANVFIFPDLNAGNIGYKITQRLGGAIAIGPILQGLKKPANDLSRGCDAEDVFNMIVVTTLQAQALETETISA